MKTKVPEVAATIFLLSVTFRLAATDFYVSPAGTTSTAVGTGTITNPWALQTALSQPAAVRPGDTIWLRGGMYTGNFTSYLTGTVRAPIVVRQYPGERATIDGNADPTAKTITINRGGYVWFVGLELTNSYPVRQDLSPATLVRGDAFYVNTPGVKIINCVIHDAGQGITSFTYATNHEIYGNLIYYNGWNLPDRGHGHGIYVQNLVGSSKLVKHNILGDVAYDGCNTMQAYGSSNSAFVNSTIEENVWYRADTYMGGLSGFSLAGSTLTRNYSWDADTVAGYKSQLCNPSWITNNYLVNLLTTYFNPSALTPPYDPLGRVGMTITGNTFIGGLDGFAPSDYPNNTYYARSSPPTANKVVVLPNAYEAGRANIVVYNWQNLSSVSVDLTGVVSPGAAYQVRNAQNFYGPPVASGTYSGGSITLPMTGLTPATPVGFATPAPTGPRFNTFIVLPSGGMSVATRVLPVVLDVKGLNGAHFSTELTLSNRGVTPASVSLAYTPAPQFGGPSGTVTDNLPPGRQLVIPDAISYLRSHGLPFGAGNQGGSLRVTFTGLSGPEASYAAARITSPSGTGRAGTAFASVRPEDGFNSKAIVFGLRQSASERSNVALVNLDASSSITLTLTAFSGAADGKTAALAPVTLGPGGWAQVNSPLAAAGFDTGFIAVEPGAGTGRFFTYGVVNDNITNDGAFIPPVADGTPPEDQILPVIVESLAFDSDLVLTNPGSQPVTVTLSYEESLASPAGGPPFTTDIALSGFEQRLIPSAIGFLRQQGLNIGPRGTATFAGAVKVQFSQNGNPAQGYAGALTAAPASQGGRYGLYYNAVPVSRAAAGDAWMLGLQQNNVSRANVAVASAGDAGEPVTCRLEVYDGDTGSLVGQLGPFAVPSGGWAQFSGVLAGFGVSNGYVRVVGTTGADHLVVYGVVNDGATPTSGGTNDGSFIPSPTN